MNTAELIARKRDGHELSSSQIRQLVDGFVSGQVADYQMSALAMAILLVGMTPEETVQLTESMLNSGARFPRQPAEVRRVDKHSTGGIGDKVSLVLAPLLACCDLAVPMISGRGLGPTGGTLDKLEAIPGFRAELSIEEATSVLEQVGCVITGASADLVPADRKLYALRDVTATVESVPLITASILSKKIAEELDALVLDVKFGNGAFMKTLAEARQLAESLVVVADRLKLPATAVLTDMNQPLGRMIGNGVEVDESVDALAGKGPVDLMEVTLTLGAELLVSAGSAPDLQNARAILTEHVHSGRGLDKLYQMVAAQGGDLDAPRPRSPAHAVAAPRSGYVCHIEARELGQIIIALRGGRSVMTDTIDPTVGMEMLVRQGDHVQAGQPIASLFCNDRQAEQVTPRLQAAMQIEAAAPATLPLVAETIRPPE